MPRRAFGAGQPGQLGLETPVEDDGPGRRLPLLAVEGGLKPLFDKRALQVV